MDDRKSPAGRLALAEAETPGTPAPTPINVLPADWNVCPDCGCGVGLQPLCAVCGCNLAAVATLPTRSGWERSTLLAHDVQARLIVERIAALVRFTPSLLALPPDERHLDSPAAVDVLRRAIGRALRESIPPAHRPAEFAVQVRCGDDRGLDSRPATASVTIGGGHTVQQDFGVALLTGRERAVVSRSGPPRVVWG